MTDEPDHKWTDEQIIAYIRHWAIERGRCGRDGYAANRINERRVFPAAKILSDRGPAAERKLLGLLDDSDPNVRLTAASEGYDLDAQACRAVLEALLKTGGIAGFMAWVVLSHKDPDSTPSISLWGTKAS